MQGEESRVRVEEPRTSCLRTNGPSGLEAKLRGLSLSTPLEASVSHNSDRRGVNVSNGTFDSRERTA